MRECVFTNGLLCSSLLSFLTLQSPAVRRRAHTIYKTHTLKPFKEPGLDSQRVKKLASKLHVHPVNLLLNLSIPDVAALLSSTVINSHQEPVSGQACNPLDPH